MFLGEMKLALLIKARAGVSLTQGLEPVLGQLCRETALRGNGGGPVGLLVSRACRHQEGIWLRLNASWRRLSCGRTSLPLPLSWEPAC
jgi:hypothetical protein